MTAKPLGYHVMLRLRDDRVIAPAVSARRALARVVLQQGEAHGLLAFRAADTHLHLEVACARPAAGELARRIELALGRNLGLQCGFAPAHLRPIESQGHLRNTFFYILRQEARHGLASDPLFEASNVPDLLGLRVVGAYTRGVVRTLLPRVRPSDLPLEIPEAAPVALLPGLAAATAAAACRPALRGFDRELREARRAAIELAGTRITPGPLARLLGISLPTLWRMRAEPASPELVRAIERQLRLRHQPAAAHPADLCA